MERAAHEVTWHFDCDRVMVAAESVSRSVQCCPPPAGNLRSHIRAFCQIFRLSLESCLPLHPIGNRRLGNPELGRAPSALIVAGSLIPIPPTGFVALTKAIRKIVKSDKVD